MKTVISQYSPFFIFLVSTLFLFPVVLPGQILDKQSVLSNHSDWCDRAGGTRFGEMVKMGDLNNDGYDDLVVHAKGADMISVYYGFSSGYLNLDAEIEYVDGTIAVEDINGDGYYDIIVGDYGDVIFYYGGSDKGDLGNSSHLIHFDDGRTVSIVAAAGDYDSDGIHDIIVDVPTTGTSYVIYGFSSTLGIPERDPQVVSKDAFIRAYGNLGDINKDGFDDVIYQREYINSQPRQVVIALGPNADISNPVWVVSGSEAGSSFSFGKACGSAGDINGDGYIDIVIGDPLFNPTPSDPSHLGNWGAVYIWFGDEASGENPSGFGSSPTLADADFTLYGNFIAGNFGYSLASGDFNGDLYSDLAIGDPRAADYCFDPESGLQDYVETGLVTPYYSALAPPDNDNDGISDDRDNCLNLYNPGQENSDDDDLGDDCDNCIYERNPEQDDSDNDGQGDACDPCLRDAENDTDNDGYCAGIGYLSPMTGDQDNCPDVYNPGQIDTDNDGIGDVCDGDDDGDGVVDELDNCPLSYNPSQSDWDSNGIGDACDDFDVDGIADALDNCPFLANPDQTDADADGIGDDCDNCVNVANGPMRGTCTSSGNICVTNAACGFDGICIMTQVDSDGDGLGDACDDDDDDDGIPDSNDNCRTTSNIGQQDTDGDGIGDECNDDFDDDDDEWADELDNCPDTPNQDQTDANNNGIGDVCENDLKVAHVEITQAIQDANNSVPLVYGKDTWIRVYFDVGPAEDTLFSIRGMIKFEYENGDPMMTFANGALRSNILLSHNQMNAIPIDSASNKAHSLNFRIPGNWRWDGQPYVELIVLYSGPDTNPMNNSPQRFKLNYHAVDLNLMFVPVYSCIGGYSEGWSACPPPKKKDFIDAAQTVYRLYPITRIQASISGSHFYSWDPTSQLSSGLQLLHALAWRDLFTDDPYDNMKYYGMVCRELPPEPYFLSRDSQIGMGHGAVAWGLRDDYHDSITVGGENMAHEIGHTILGNEGYGKIYEVWGAHVPDNCGARDPLFENYPASSPNLGLIDANGFYDNKVYPQTEYYDLMTYSPCPTAPGEGKWISTYTYKLLFNKLYEESHKKSTPEEYAEGEFFAISGIVNRDYSNDSLKCHRLTLSSGDYSYEGEGSYRIELLDDGNNILFTRHFKNQSIVPAEANDTSVVFFEILPYDQDARTIVIRNDNYNYATIGISTNVPQVSIEYPNGGETLSGLCDVRWTASDADGEALKFDLLYSKDGGTNWDVIATNLTGTSYSWNVDEFAGCDQGMIKVLASDGANTGEDISDEDFSVENKSPSVFILSPGDQESFFLNRTAVFKGEGIDLEDTQLEDSQFTWTSDIDGTVAQGRHISADSLTAGNHIITLSVEDSDNNTGSASITIQVFAVEDTDGDGLGDDVDTEPYADNSQSSSSEKPCVPTGESDPGNLLKNGKFGECILAPWEFYLDPEVTADISIQNGACFISSQSLAGNPGIGDIQFNQLFSQEQLDSLNAGKFFELSFKAFSAKNGRPCHILLGEDGQTVNGDLDENIQIGREPKTYSFEFERNSTYSSCNLSFELGTDTSWMAIDNVRLIHIPTTEIDDHFLSTLKIYPNPAEDYILLDIGSTLTDKKIHLQLYSLSGVKHMETTRVINGIYKIDLSTYSKGLYLMNIEYENQVITKKIVIY